jgi:hypothetical protein
MTVNNLSLFDGVLTATLASAYVSATGVTAIIKAATFCNVTAGVVALTVTLTPRTGGTARTVIQAQNVSVGETFFGSEMINQVLEPGGEIQVQGLGIEGYISGVEIS